MADKDKSKDSTNKQPSPNGTVDRDGAKSGWGPPTQIADYNKATHGHG